MPQKHEHFESFREGMGAGYEAGRTEDFLYAVGFLAGFIWGAVTSIRLREPRGVDEIPKTA